MLGEGTERRVFTDHQHVQFSSISQSSLTLRNPMDHSMPGLPVHHQLSEFTKLRSTVSVMPSNHLILCRLLLLLPLVFSSIRVFSNESALCIRWPKYWSFSFNISPTNEHPGLISFRVDWLDLVVVQGTLKSLLQHHSSKASVLQCSAFFISTLLPFFAPPCHALPYPRHHPSPQPLSLPSLSAPASPHPPTHVTS